LSTGQAASCRGVAGLRIGTTNMISTATAMPTLPNRVYGTAYL